MKNRPALIKIGDVYQILAPAAKVIDSLPQETFEVKFDPSKMLFSLEKMIGFEIPRKIRGKIPLYAERILVSYRERKPGESISSLLVGEKGSGKTLLSKLISVESGLPVVNISSDFGAKNQSITVELVKFVQSLGPIVIVIDEFDKTFCRESKDTLLSLFDGTSTIRDCIGLVTANSQELVGDYFFNRPTRFRYNIKFSSLSREEIQEILEETVVPKYTNHINMALSHLEKIPSNYDCVISLAREINRWGDLSWEDIITPFNVKEPLSMSHHLWITGVFYNDKLVLTTTIPNWDPVYKGNSNFWVQFSLELPKDLLEDDDEDEDTTEAPVVTSSSQKKHKYFSIHAENFKGYTDAGEIVFNYGGFEFRAKREIRSSTIFDRRAF